MKHSSLGKNWPKTADSRIFSTWCAPHILKRWKSWNHLEQARTTRSELELSGTRCNQLYQDGTSTKLTQKNKKFIRKKLRPQYHFPKRYKISNSYCRKGMQSQIFTGETAWNMIEPVTNWHKSSDNHRAKLCVQCH